MIQYSKVIGANTDHKSAQAFFFPKTTADDQQEGQIFLGCIITGQGEDVFTKIRQASPFIEEQFYSSGDVLSVRIPFILDQLKKELAAVENLQIIFVCIKDEILYVLSTGVHTAFLLRNNKVMDLTEGQPKEQLISGYIKPEDTILLINSEAIMGTEGHPDRSRAERLIHIPLDALEEEVTSIFQHAEEPEPVASILISNILPKKVIPDLTQVIPQIQDEVRVQRKKIPIRPLLHILMRIMVKIMPKTRKTIALTSIILISIIAAAALYWTMTRGVRERAAEELKVLSQARQKLSEAQTFKDSDPKKSQQILADSKALVNSVLADNSKNEEAVKFKQELENSSADILKIYNVTDWPVFLSLDLIKSNFKADKMSYSLQKVLLLDPVEKTLVSVDLAQKTNQILSGQTQLGDAQIASLNGSNAFVYSRDKGIVKVDTEDKKVTTVSEPTEEWGEIKDIVGFASNVYVLDSGKNQIWKYIPTQTSYSENIAYIKDGQAVSLVGALRMQIDFSVWILKPGPEIIKLTGGSSDYFGVSGIDTNLQDVTSFFVAEDGDDIYFLEPSNSRLVVLKKNGEYKHQYKGDKFRTAQDFVVDEESKKIYLLENNIIYQIDLRS